MVASAIGEAVQQRGFRRLTAGGICGQTAQRITRQPFTAIAVTFAVGLLAGVVIGRLEAKRRLIAALGGQEPSAPEVGM